MKAADALGGLHQAKVTLGQRQLLIAAQCAGGLVPQARFARRVFIPR